MEDKIPTIQEWLVNALRKQIAEKNFVLPDSVKGGGRHCPCCWANPDHQHYAHCALAALLDIKPSEYTKEEYIKKYSGFQGKLNKGFKIVYVGDELENGKHKI